MVEILWKMWNVLYRMGKILKKFYDIYFSSYDCELCGVIPPKAPQNLFLFLFTAVGGFRRRRAEGGCSASNGEVCSVFETQRT